MAAMTASSHKVVPLQQQDQGEGKETRTGQAVAGRRLSSGLISVQVQPLEEEHASGCWVWLRYRLEAFRFVGVCVAVIVPGVLLGAWASYALSDGKSVGNEGSWFAFDFSECVTEMSQQDARLSYWLTVVAFTFFRCSLAISTSQFMMVKNVWLHEVGAWLFVTFISWFVAQETIFKAPSKAGLLLFLSAMFFFYSWLAILSRRVAQYRSSTKRNKKKRFLQKCAQDLTLASVYTIMSLMSTLYLIASERSSGMTDIFINGVGYPTLITGFRIFLHKFNQRALQEKKTTDKERQVEIAGLVSSIVVSVRCT